MNISNKKLDALILLYGDVLIDEDVEYFDSIDTSDIQISPRFNRKMHRMINIKSWQNEYKQLIFITKKIAAVVLIACTILLASSMSIGAVRAAFWNAVVEWYDTYISVSFNVESAVPNTIEEKREPRNVPDNYEKEITSDTPVSYRIVYRFNGEKMVSYQQMVFIPQDVWIDNENCTVRELYVNDNKAILAEYSDADKYFILLWNDGEYSYMLSCFDNTITSDDFIGIAESIK